MLAGVVLRTGSAQEELATATIGTTAIISPPYTITHATIIVTMNGVTGVVQMAAQVKQLEQKLMALREELREREAKARQAEGSVQDLKLQLEDLQVCQSATWCPRMCHTH